MMCQSKIISNELIEFIKNNTFVNPQKIIPDATLEQDLQLTGFDAIEFILKYGEHFKVDVSKFMAADYFAPEGEDNFWRKIIGIFFKLPSNRKVITVYDLQKGIDISYLNEDVISKLS